LTTPSSTAGGRTGGHPTAIVNIKINASAMGTVFAILFFIEIPPLCGILLIFIRLSPLELSKNSTFLTIWNSPSRFGYHQITR
jgi:hypothetical protein